MRWILWAGEPEMPGHVVEELSRIIAAVLEKRG
jgi:hypothetical protein